MAWVKDAGKVPGFLGCSIYDTCRVSPTGNRLGCSPRQRFLLPCNPVTQSPFRRIIEGNKIVLLLCALCYYFYLEFCHHTPGFLRSTSDGHPCVTSPYILRWLSRAQKIKPNSLVHFNPNFASLSPETTQPRSLFVSER